MRAALLTRIATCAAGAGTRGAGPGFSAAGAFKQLRPSGLGQPPAERGLGRENRSAAPGPEGFKPAPDPVDVSGRHGTPGIGARKPATDILT